jgi:selenocysteine lyase/cysteine desulfurase
VGVLNLDLSNSGIDFLTCATYKWLLGPQGLGLFYIRPALLDTFEPIYSGWIQLKNWLSDPKTIVDNLHTSARKFQTASFDPHAITQMNAALDLILSVGTEKIEAHNLSLARQLWQGLSSLGLSLITPKPIQSAIVTCEISPEIGIEQKLADSGCIATEREGLLRFSPHLYNNEEEINKVLKIVEHIVS